MSEWKDQTLSLLFATIVALLQYFSNLDTWSRTLLIYPSRSAMCTARTSIIANVILYNIYIYIHTWHVIIYTFIYVCVHVYICMMIHYYMYMKGYGLFEGREIACLCQLFEVFRVINQCNGKMSQLMEDSPIKTPYVMVPMECGKSRQKTMVSLNGGVKSMNGGWD